MQTTDFSQIKEDFAAADVDGKIRLYVESEGLTQDQYKELLRLFPLEELSKLEDALE